MKTPRLALAALLSALGTGASVAQPLTQPLMPIVSGPAGPGQCVVGIASCGAGPEFSMDPATEGILVGLGEPMAPPALNNSPVAKTPMKVSVPKVDAPPAPDETDAVAAMGVGIGGIINPPGTGALVASKGSPAPAGPATLGAAFGGGDSSGIDSAAAPAAADAQPFSFRKAGRAAAAISRLEGDVPPPDPKLSPDDANLAPGTTRAASNSR